ncbi:MAG: alpha-amylase/4-alpha-glucanotransferase domain-containing protein [Vicinamibacterales bacterium]
MTAPIRFVFGVHLHQPVGNFDHVFAQHLDEVYFPFLQKMADRRFGPIVLHCSGPLLDWLAERPDGTRYLDLLGRLVSDGQVELLMAGYHEPILAVLPRQDRVEQIVWLRDAIQRRFGVTPQGLWLTERVWEPDLPADLAEAGVRSVLVDDRHFLVSGFEPSALHRPWTTEHSGRQVTLVPIHERLRYLVPFRPPDETVQYLRELRNAGQPLAVLADDGEKFGGWPGTREWVYEKGWLDQFLTAITEATERGEVQLSTVADAVAAVPSGGLAYLPTASYREMEGWSLPATAARRLAALEHDLGDRATGPDGSLVRGSHWRHFLAKYSESNRMHKKMLAISALCRKAGDPPEARQAIGRAQCNDAYWHGVFGGLYLPFLRAAIWRELAVAEGILRRGSALTHERLDLDADGQEEIWVHGQDGSALIAPHRGGALEEFSDFAKGINYADVLTRREESYHQLGTGGASTGHDEGGAPSIHDLEARLAMTTLPPRDHRDRVMLTERVLRDTVDEHRYARAEYEPAWSAGDAGMVCRVDTDGTSVQVVCTSGGDGRPVVGKRFHLGPEASLRVDYTWNPSAFPDGSWFAPELSLATMREVTCDPPAEVWRYEIMTVAKSESGLEETRQGTSLTPRWPVALGAASFTFGGR